MTYYKFDPATQNRVPWNVGAKIAPKRPFNQKQIWAIRFFLDREQRICYSDLSTAALTALGQIKIIVAPNSYHFLHIGEWAAAHPSAKLLVPRSAPEKVKAQCDFLDDDVRGISDTELLTKCINLGQYQETVFFHPLSRTLIVTDLTQNFEAGRVRKRLTRFLLKVGRATGPTGQPSIEIRHAARNHRAALNDGIQQMLDWQPTQIIPAHGKCYRSDAVSELNKASSCARK